MLMQDNRPTKLAYLCDSIQGVGGNTWRKGTTLKN